MGKDIGVLFLRFKNMPFPELGKVVGDFALYDSLMAGTVSSFLAGKKIALKAMPAPDQETEKTLKALKKKAKRTEQEADLLKYAHLLDTLRSEVVRAAIRR